MGPGSYPGGAKVSGGQMAALPLDRHNWHGGLQSHPVPEPRHHCYRRGRPPRRPERPDWAHPALTGLGFSDWNQVISALAIPYQAQRHRAPGVYQR